MARRRKTRRRRSYPRSKRTNRVRGGKTLSITLIALLIEALSILGFAGARTNTLKTKLDGVAANSVIPAGTFLGTMLILQAAAMIWPSFARKVNGRLKSFGLRL